MTLFTRYIEVGRLAIGRFGNITNKPVIIVDILDFNRVIVDGPQIERQLISIKRIALTEYKIDLERGAPTKDVIEQLAKNDIVAKWTKSAWGQKQLRTAKKLQLNDFGRFKFIQARKEIAKAQYKH